jgi:hypothetical protein
MIRTTGRALSTLAPRMFGVGSALQAPLIPDNPLLFADVSGWSRIYEKYVPKF